VIPASSVLEAISIAAIEAADDYLQDHWGEEFGTPRMPAGYVDECRERFNEVLMRAIGEGVDLCNELPSPADYARDADEQYRVDASMGDR
jgi:hypothetical protein